MSDQKQFRRGTTTDHATFTGAVGEVTVDTTKDCVVVHDGSTAGGHPAAKESHQHDAETVFSGGVVPTANLGSGTADATTYLRGDQTWAAAAGGHTITEEDGTALTQRAILNFTSTPTGVVAVSDDSGTGATDVAINATLPPATNTDGNIPQWNGANSKTLKDGLSLVTTLGDPGANTAVPSEAAVRAAISAAGGGDVSSDTSTSVEAELALFKGTAGKTIQRATGSGLAKVTAGVLSTVTAPSGTVVGTTDTQTLTNKTITIADNVLTIQDNADATKQLQLNASGITAGQTRVLSAPDASTTLVGDDAAQTLTNKTIVAASNSITIALDYLSDVTITSASLVAGQALRYNGSAFVNGGIAGADISSGTVALTRGGLATDASSFAGLLTITAGVSSFRAAPTGTVVGTSDTQTLTNKTLTTPTIGDFTNAGHTHITTATGGQLNVVSIANNAASAHQVFAANSAGTAWTFRQLASTDLSDITAVAGATDKDMLAYTLASSVWEVKPVATIRTNLAIGTDPVGATSANYVPKYSDTSGNRSQSGVQIDASNNLYLPNAAQLRLYEPVGGGANYVALAAPSLAGNLTYTLPNSYGASGQLLSSDGAGGLSWYTAEGTGNVTGPTPSSSSDNAIVRWNGTDGTAIQNSSITISDSLVITNAIFASNATKIEDADASHLYTLVGGDLAGDITLTLPAHTTNDTLLSINNAVAVANKTSYNKVILTAPADQATLTIANSMTLVTVGAHPVRLIASGASSVTLPTAGTLATIAGAEALTSKTVNGLLFSAPTNAARLTLANSSTLITEGAYDVTLKATGTSSLTLPVLGTLATVAGAEALTSKTVNGLLFSAPANAARLTLANSSTLITEGAYDVTLKATGATSLTLPVAGTLLSTSGVDLSASTLKLPASVTISSLVFASGHLGIDLDGTSAGSLTTSAPVYYDGTGLRYIPSFTNSQIADAAFDQVVQFDGYGKFALVNAEDAVADATTAVAGKVMLATASLVNVGAATSLAITPDAYAGSNLGRRGFEVQLIDKATTVAASMSAWVNLPSYFAGMNLIRAQGYVDVAGEVIACQVQHLTTHANTVALSSPIVVANSATVGTVGTVDTAADNAVTDELVRLWVVSVTGTAPKGLRISCEYSLP